MWCWCFVCEWWYVLLSCNGCFFGVVGCGCCLCSVFFVCWLCCFDLLLLGSVCCFVGLGLVVLIWCGLCVVSLVWWVLGLVLWCSCCLVLFWLCLRFWFVCWCWWNWLLGGCCWLLGWCKWCFVVLVYWLFFVVWWYLVVLCGWFVFVLLVLVGRYWVMCRWCWILKWV